MINKRPILSILFAAICLAAPVSNAFDLEQAAVLEGQFRSIAVQCGDPEFATTFVGNSKLHVAAMLQGTDQASIELVESAIRTVMDDPSMANIPEEKCQKLIGPLKQLDESRLGALMLSQELSKSMIGGNR